MRQHGLLRPLKASEFSDGTLRYLLLLAALMTPRPPPLMILNEPETSLHPDLLPPLARLIASASSRSQIIVVTHAAKLVTSLRDAGARQVILTKELGETVVTEDERRGWNWASRSRIRTRDQHIGPPQFLCAFCCGKTEPMVYISIPRTDSAPPDEIPIGRGEGGWRSTRLRSGARRGGFF